MSTNEKVNVQKEGSVSKSKQKRIDRQKKNEQVKREGVIGSVVGILAIVLIIGAVVFSIVASINKQQTNVEPNNDYGKCLTEEGKIEGINASSIVTLPADYNNIKVPKSEVEYTDEEFEEEKASQLESHKVLNRETEEPVKDEDKVNIDYVGSIDGVEFEGGSTDGNGADLVIGSDSYIPGFEEQIIGHKVGDVFDINVTFPEEYASEDLAGKDAVFNITLNGIYEVGEFTDEFVAENLKAYATTVDGYKKYMQEKTYEERLDAYISNYIDENSTVSKYPKKYLTQLMALKKYSDQSSFEYMNQMYQQMYGYGFTNFREYSGMTDEEYEESVVENSRKAEAAALTRQAIAEKEGIVVTDENIKTYIEKLYGEGSYDSTLESYGKPYLAQTALDGMVQDFLVNNATVE